MEPTGQILSSLRQWLDASVVSGSYNAAVVPVTTLDRQKQSLDDLPIEISQLSKRTAHSNLKDTVLYLGYGSNLSAEAFLGKRNIKPLSQVNVVVPALSLTFDLPGLPYTEPCFGNVRYRDSEECLKSKGYHKDHWHKGLVGVVYEVTREDYVTIIATEGGGAGYQDVLVDCYAISGGRYNEVPCEPSGASFKAHTLYDPTGSTKRAHSYAQPSARYLKLITDGAAEHSLPEEYQDFLGQIRTYQMTTTKQRLGQFIYLSVWAPMLMFIFGASKIFTKPDGTFPSWLAKLIQAIFTASWASYDKFFKKTFGDGERTIGDDEDHKSWCRMDEKTPLIRRKDTEV